MRKTVVLCLAVLAVALLATCCKPDYEFNLDEHIGICGLGRAEAAEACGLDYIEATVSGFLIPEQSEEDFAANKALAAEIDPSIYSANGFYPGEIKLVGPDADLERAVNYANTAIRRASEIGMKILVLGSGGARNIPEGFSREEAEKQFVALLKGMAPAAEEYDIKIGIEPLQPAETNFINSVKEGAEISRKAGSPNIGVIADLFHVARVNEPPQDIIDAADKLVHCHIAEVEERTPPGVKGDDFTPYFKALKDIKYDGRISIECGWADIDAQLPVAIETMKKQIQSVK